ncbi:MAG TPA: hypothetical protein VF652_11175 [Allosphingosinicella sp.]
MGTLRFVLLKHPLLALAIGLAALVLRLAVPAGYMPVVGQPGPALTLCPGGGQAAATAHQPHGDPSMPGPAHGADPGDSARSCAFADLALPAIGGADPFQLAEALTFIPASALLPSSPLPPRAALRLRPPLRGPPLPN